MSGAFLPRLKSRVSCAEFMNDERYVVGQVKAKYNGEDQLFDVLDDGTVILPNGETTKTKVQLPLFQMLGKERRRPMKR